MLTEIDRVESEGLYVLFAVRHQKLFLFFLLFSPRTVIVFIGAVGVWSASARRADVKSHVPVSHSLRFCNPARPKPRHNPFQPLCGCTDTDIRRRGASHPSPVARQRR